MFGRTATATSDGTAVRDETAGRGRGPVRRRGRGRAAAAGAAGAVGSGVLLIARAIRLVATIVALIIGAGILLVVLKANLHNGIVSAVHDAAKALAGPFDGMFTPKDHRVAIAVNWGVALVVYLIAGSLLAGLVARFGGAARARGRRV
jgi:hypothetical protein